MQTINCRTTAFILCANLFFVSVLGAADEDLDDVQDTGAFLVKLKPGADAAASRAGVDDQWEFTPLQQDMQSRGEPNPSGNWWLLAPRSGGSATRQSAPAETITSWDAAYQQYVNESETTRGPGQPSETALAARGIGSDQVEFIEPDFIYRATSEPLPPPITNRNAPAGADVVVAGSAQTGQWPRFQSIGTFQELNYSQLKAARDSVQRKIDKSHEIPVRVAFLDNGYDPNHVARPPHVNTDLARNFVEDDRTPDGVSLKDQPGPLGSQSHGTGTIGIFGGGFVKFAEPDGRIFSDFVGGAPMTEIIPMRVATWVVHLNENPVLEMRPSGTTRAIRYAIKNNCDVISMSHGGLPSRALADAINDAYESGIAMFFASGDYLEKAPIPFRTPRYVVYPAAFPRTMCVCGVTADFTTYGVPPKGSGAVLRGNWGPSAWMKNAIAAFSPNIPWAHLPNREKGETQENIIDLDGQGTSASTPQVAAAAALWLQYHRSNKILKDNWRTWRKAEAVYTALRSTAKPGKDKNYTTKFFGNGILQAKKALDKNPEDLVLREQKEAKVGLGWIQLLASTLPVIRGTELSANEVMDGMLNLEIAQLAQRSVKLQEIIERFGYMPDAGIILPKSRLADFRREFFTALKEDPRCSNRLKQVVDKALAQP